MERASITDVVLLLCVLSVPFAFALDAVLARHDVGKERPRRRKTRALPTRHKLRTLPKSGVRPLAQVREFGGAPGVNSARRMQALLRDPPPPPRPYRILD